mmetsp:Transcript_4869/g.6337  ORF Transcript_4869/g.6337 Transcript_4869/m.6337 type:complete len:605 (+) Transcript_4869:741-2555(+)
MPSFTTSSLKNTVISPRKDNSHDKSKSSSRDDINGSNKISASPSKPSPPSPLSPPSNVWNTNAKKVTPHKGATTSDKNAPTDITTTCCSMKEIFLEQQRQKEKEQAEECLFKKKERDEKTKKHPSRMTPSSSRRHNHYPATPPRSSLQAALHSIASPSTPNHHHRAQSHGKKKHSPNVRQSYSNRAPPPTAATPTSFASPRRGDARRNHPNRSQPRTKPKGQKPHHQQRHTQNYCNSSSSLPVSSHSSFHQMQHSYYDNSITATENLTPPSPNRNKYISLDCEMVGIGPNGAKSALARICILNWYNQTLLDTFVKVTEPITDYRTSISGVRQKDITSEDAMDYEECKLLVSSILKGKILVGHALKNDLQVLGIQHPWYDIRDTAKYAPFMAPSSCYSSSSLGGAAVPATTSCDATATNTSASTPSVVESDCSSSTSSLSSSSSSSLDISSSSSSVPYSTSSSLPLHASSSSSSPSLPQTPPPTTQPSSSSYHYNHYHHLYYSNNHYSHHLHYYHHLPHLYNNNTIDDNYIPTNNILFQQQLLRPRKLKDLANEKLGIEIQKDGNEHDPKEDAIAALDLYKLVCDDWERVMEYKVLRTREIMEEC